MKTKGIYFLYRVLQALGWPVLILYLIVRGIRNRGYFKSLPERFGFLPASYRQTGPGAIWLHAVSVGEVLACAGLLRRLRTAYPNSGLFVSTSTLAGRAMAGEKLKDLADGVFYAPFDFVAAVRRVLRALKPSVVIVAETEIWPNLFREVKRTRAGLMIVNGRISDRAFPRYQRFRWFFQAILPAADAVLAQTEEIRERFLLLGAAPGGTTASGNLKYDFEALPVAQPSPVMALLESVRPGKVWVAASTTAPVEAGDPDEDDVVLAAFRELGARYRDLLLILAPRKPERFDSVARKLEAAGIPFVRRSVLDARAVLELPGVLLLDTIGELSGLFAAADVVFMGGTLPRRGGHNILEPALFGKPVIAGPHMENFRDIAEQFRKAGAYVEISNDAELAPAVARLLNEPKLALEIGRRGLACAEERRGATERAMAEVGKLHRQHLPHYRPAVPWIGFLWLLSRVWGWGGRRRQERDLKRRRALGIPVISVGNLTMGGTGKTPCVLRLAELLKERGRKPGILTRGYGRVSPEKQLLLAPGAVVRTEYSGDEPQIFVRSKLAPVGIGGNRFETGTLLRREFDIDRILLDDGFQHVRLARDVDIVLVDALNPFGGGELFPLGRLREPPEGLSRADIVLVTRSDVSDNFEAIQFAVRQWNRQAGIYRAEVAPIAWVERSTGQEYALNLRPFGRAGAFCGLGNPQSFRRTLEKLGLTPAFWAEFEDHHRYRPHELKRVALQAGALGATALVTTEKDAINLCEGSDELMRPLKLYWLKVAMRIEGEAVLVSSIEERIG